MLVYLSLWVFILERSDILPVTLQLTHSLHSKAHKVELVWVTRLHCQLNFSFLLNEKSGTILNIKIYFLTKWKLNSMIVFTYMS